MSFKQISAYIYQEQLGLIKTIDYSVLNKTFQEAWDFSLIEVNPLIVQSFIHKSFEHEHQQITCNNERLELLGDSVLQLIVTKKLYRRYPKLKEGDLSKLRSSLVNEQALTELAKLLNLGKWCLLGRGELKEQGYQKSSILSDTFEALLGAIFESYSWEAVQHFFDQVLDLYEKKYQRAFIDDEVKTKFDAKTQLQEKIVREFKVHPVYECIENEEKRGDKNFLIRLKVNEKIIGEIKHFSKKKGMQILAQKVLEQNII